MDLRIYILCYIEDAIGYGGNYVFEVMFDNLEVPDYWEFVSQEIIVPDRIIELTFYKTDKLYRNEHLRDKVFKSNIEEYERGLKDELSTV